MFYQILVVELIAGLKHQVVIFIENLETIDEGICLGSVEPKVDFSDRMEDCELVQVDSVLGLAAITVTHQEVVLSVDFCV